MTAQIIEFPVDRVRRPAMVSKRESSRFETTVSQVRPSIRVARLVIFISLVVAVVSWLSLAGSNSTTPAQANDQISGSSQSNFVYVTVQSGDTLWSLASRYAPDQDPRDFIANLVALNNLDENVLSAGMQLALPLN